MSEDLVTIARFRFIHEAELAKSRLEDADIPVVIADAAIVGMNVVLGQTVSYIKLRVPKTAVETANAILAKTAGVTTADESGMLSDTAGMSCLACGTPMAPADSRCTTCDWSYQDE